MILKDIVTYDIVNYKKPCMFLIFPCCSFKCDKENGNQYCQNWHLAKQKNIEISTEKVIDKYYDPSFVSSVVCGGLEPLDSFDELIEFIDKFREIYDDDIVIYTGYNKEEIKDKIELLSKFKNIIIKFGRYRPNQKPHYDKILGVDLASDNQYTERLS